LFEIEGCKICFPDTGCGNDRCFAELLVSKLGKVVQGFFLGIIWNNLLRQNPPGFGWIKKFTFLNIDRILPPPTIRLKEIVGNINRFVIPEPVEFIDCRLKRAFPIKRQIDFAG